MAIVINGSGTVTGLSVGGLPDGTVDSGTIATGTIVDADVANVAASKLTGALPAISGASLTNLPSKGKNLIINGAMQVAQRGTSSTFGQSDKSYKTVDRFKVWEQGAPTAVFNLTQETDAPSKFKYSTKLACTTANTSGIPANVHMYVQYAPEASDLHRLAWGTSDAKTATLSFSAKSNLAGTYVVAFQAVGSANGIGDTANEYYTAPYTLDGSGNWQDITLTIPANTLSNTKLAADNSVGMEIKWIIQSSTDYSSGTALTAWTNSPAANQLEAGQTADLGATVGKYWQITGVQLEVGSTATDFEHRSYGEELALCQRYYEVITGGCGMGIVKSSTAADCSFQPKVNKRAAPTISFSGTFYANDGSAQQGATLSSTGGTQDGLIVVIAFSSLNTGRACMLYTQSVDHKLTVDAEL